jgi:hypothetical protein
VRYALLMYTVPADTKAMTRADFDVVMEKHAALRDELTESGELAGGAGLVLPEQTTTLRWSDGEVTTANGPLLEGDEHMTGFYLVDCADRDRALAIGEHVLDFHVTSVEVREIHDTA